MLYHESESRWLDRRALEIAVETGWPVPVARSEAAGQLTRMREKPSCPVVLLAECRAGGTLRNRAAATPAQARGPGFVGKDA